MKKYYALPFLLILAIQTTAQPILQQSNGFKDGTLIHLYTDDSPSLNEGNSGIDKTWNFSSLSYANPQTDFTGMLPSATPFSNDFLNADVASVSIDFSGNPIYNYFTNAIDHYTTWGYESNSQKLIYSDPRDILRFPFSFGSNFTDSYYGSLEVGYNSGQVEIAADGFGNLILPGGIFYNCLRIREVRKDTLAGALILTTSIDTSYKFYVAGYPEPLCQVTYHHSSGGLHFNEIYWQDVQPSGVSSADNDETFLLFPNPCHDVLNISISSPDKQASLKIMDASGRFITPDYRVENHALQLNTASLSDGVYFLYVNTKEKQFVTSFIKSRE